MAFRIEISSLALRDLEEAYLWLANHSPRRAAAWYNGLVAAIYSLEAHPARCALAPENEDLEFELRQLLFGKNRGIYRILFRICDGELVRVYRVRHGAQEWLTPEDFDE